MLSGGLGQQTFDAYGNPVPPGGGGILAAAGQSSVIQTPIGQWGFGEWAVAGVVAYVVYSVFFTTKRGVSSARGAVGSYRQRRAKEYEAMADAYKR